MIRDGIRRVLHLALRRRDRWEQEVEDEIKMHLALRAEQLAAGGRSAADAYDEAVRRFGPLGESRARLVEAARHREQHMQRTELVDDLRRDVWFAWRTLGRQKAWTAVTIATLALGIGATTAVFSVVSTLLLHPLPYPAADRIVFVDQQPSSGNGTGVSVTIAAAAPVVRAWKANSRVFEALEPQSNSGPRQLKTVSGDPGRVMAASILPSFAAFAGQRPLLGRMFTQSDIDNGGGVVVLGEVFWRERLGADRGVLGKVLTIGDSSYAIVGVMPADFRFGAAAGRPTDVWLPLDLRNDQLGMSVLGRLQPGMTPAVAMRELDSIFARATGFTGGKNIPFRTVVSTPSDRLDFRDSLVMLAWAVTLVLLVSCSNVAHLLLARSTTRQREMAIRVALGAGRARLLRQLLTESLMLSVSGAVLGVLVGWLGLRTLVSMRPRALDSLAGARLDPTTLGLAAGVAIASACVFALIGAVQSWRIATNDALKGGVAPNAGRRRARGRAVLVVSEMALSGTLLVGAVLVVRSVMHLQRADLGFDPTGLYTLTARLTAPRFAAPESRAAAIAGVMSRLRALPHVKAASVARVAPGSRSFSVGRLQIEGEPAPARESSAFIDINAVGADYFNTMRMHVVEGGTFTDTTAAAHQVIVNAGFARKHWQPGRAVGQRLRIAQTDSEPWLTIVGVVNDALTTGPLAQSTAPLLYTAATGHEGAPAIMVRTDGDAKGLAPAMSVLVQSGAERPMPPISVEQMMARSIAAPRFVMLLLAIFTGLALVLAGVGLYGVMSYTVAQQTRDIGIRVALGASDRRIAGAVLARGSVLAGTGAVIGLATAAWATKLIETQLHGVQRLDPMSFAIGAVVLAAAALTACVVPTRRALRVDPIAAIRAD